MIHVVTIKTVPSYIKFFRKLFRIKLLSNQHNTYSSLMVDTISPESEEPHRDQEERRRSVNSAPAAATR